MRYAGIKNGKISILSEQVISNKDLEVLEVPEELEHLSNTDLIVSCRVVNGKLVSKFARKKAKNMKVAFITNWAMACGLSTYSENLLPEIAKHIGEFKLFIEENNNWTKDVHQFGNSILNDDQISICWKRGEKLNKLIAEIKAYNPDIVLLNHEFGIWQTMPFLSLLTQLSAIKTICIAHSIFPTHFDKSVSETAMPEIITHLEGAKDALIKKGLKQPIHVISHGCYPINEDKLWNCYRSKNTLIQTGFGHPYKNFQSSIKVISLLKDKYPDIFLTIIFSESEHAKINHQLYYNELMELITQLKLEDNIGIIRGFQNDSVIESFYKTNRVALFPYESDENNKVFGASGSARLAMAMQIPVITSRIYHFSDLPTIKGDTSEEIAIEVDKLFSDWKLINQQVKLQNEFIKDNSWENAAKQYVKVFENT